MSLSKSTDIIKKALIQDYEKSINRKLIVKVNNNIKYVESEFVNFIINEMGNVKSELDKLLAITDLNDVEKQLLNRDNNK